MEFSKRIAVIACVATWGCVIAGVVAALLTRYFVPAAPVEMPAVLAWSAFGAGLATLTTVLAFRAQQRQRALTQTVAVGRLLLITFVVYITGLACASGGLRGGLAGIDAAGRDLPSPRVGDEAMAPQQQHTAIGIAHDRSRGMVGHPHDVVLEPFVARDLHVDEHEPDPLTLVDAALAVHRPLHREDCRC